MRAKKLITLVPILCLLCALCNVAYAAPVYIDGLSDFPGYPYNDSLYANAAGDLIGCGPTTGAMILGYFEHHFGATGLLTNPVAGVTEGLDTAWELHSQSYMKVNTLAMELADPTGVIKNGFSSPEFIKPGMEDYAEDRGYEIKVMVHYEIGVNPADVNTAWYGAYGEGWTDDVDWWIDLPGDNYEIDDDKFCDWVEAKLAAGIGVWLSIDPGNPTGSATPLGSADHWVPCVGVDKDAGIYYFYDTWDPTGTSMRNAEIASAGALAGSSTFAIGWMRTVTYIGPTIVAPWTIESCDSTGAKKDTFQPTDEVYATGTGYSPSTTYDVYLVEDVTWVDGMAIPPRVPGTAATVTSDGAGNVPATLLWDDPLVPGKYDIVVDVDGDGLYFAESDALDDMDIEVTAGLLIIPEVALGTIMALAAMVLALVVYVAVPKWKRRQTRLNP